MPYNLILEYPINVDPISLLFFFIQLCGASGLRHRRPFLVKVIYIKYILSKTVYVGMYKCCMIIHISQLIAHFSALNLMH